MTDDGGGHFFDGFEEENRFDDREFAEDDGMDEGFAPDVVRAEVHTVCHLCGGVGEIADPVLAMRGGMPFTINPGRQCPGCDGEGHLPGIQAPV